MIYLQHTPLVNLLSIATHFVLVAYLYVISYHWM